MEALYGYEDSIIIQLLPTLAELGPVPELPVVACKGSIKKEIVPSKGDPFAVFPDVAVVHFELESEGEVPRSLALSKDVECGKVDI